MPEADKPHILGNVARSRRGIENQGIDAVRPLTMVNLPETAVYR